MTTWIALLRGINVGGRHKLPMKSLVGLMEEAGFADARTYIQSGNAVFRSRKKPGTLLGELIERDFGFRPAILYLTATDLRRAVDASPFDPLEGKHLHLFFCDAPPADLDTDFLDALKTPTEQYHLDGRVFYLYTPDGFGRSKFAEKMGKAFRGVDMTARNLNTARKLIEIADGLD